VALDVKIKGDALLRGRWVGTPPVRLTVSSLISRSDPRRGGYWVQNCKFESKQRQPPKHYSPVF
jgi:hypothetical protein